MILQFSPQLINSNQQQPQKMIRVESQQEEAHIFLKTLHQLISSQQLVNFEMVEMYYQRAWQVFPQDNGKCHTKQQTLTKCSTVDSLWEGWWKIWLYWLLPQKTLGFRLSKSGNGTKSILPQKSTSIPSFWNLGDFKISHPKTILTFGEQCEAKMCIFGKSLQRHLSQWGKMPKNCLCSDR